ncbi:hypothetical protein VTN96DRAFT_8997 [Rasamsonia emersonii]
MHSCQQARLELPALELKPWSGISGRPTMTRSGETEAERFREKRRSVRGGVSGWSVDERRISEAGQVSRNSLGGLLKGTAFLRPESIGPPGWRFGGRSTGYLAYSGQPAALAGTGYIAASSGSGAHAAPSLIDATPAANNGMRVQAVHRAEYAGISIYRDWLRYLLSIEGTGGEPTTAHVLLVGPIYVEKLH